MNSLFNIERNLHRKIIGCLGLIVPFILTASAWVFGCGEVQTSISAYYHTSVQNIFSWIVIIIGIFFLAYPILENYKADQKPFRIAGILALLVAFFPTFLSETNTTSCSFTENTTQLSGYIHNASAVSFFLLLAYICIFLFTKSNKTFAEMPNNKKLSNRFYKLSGYTIVICIILIVIYEFWAQKKFPELRDLKPTFLLESIALIFFGLAYLIKGKLFSKES